MQKTRVKCKKSAHKYQKLENIRDKPAQRYLKMGHEFFPTGFRSRNHRKSRNFIQKPTKNLKTRRVFRRASNLF
jgi:hypothetical protein